MTKKAILLFSLCILFPSATWADSEVACDSSCPAGKVMTSYADGNSVTCMCVDDAQMEPTVPDPNVPTGDDPDNTH
ncbi:MAG: hypothetical protein J5J00_12435 [Deltaproteobacteria bacterium]|nr:hypothetical protein [Deltaproteobacteria bacterium]